MIENFLKFALFLIVLIFFYNFKYMKINSNGFEFHQGFTSDNLKKMDYNLKNTFIVLFFYRIVWLLIFKGYG